MAEAAAEAEPKKKGKKGLILVLLAAVVLLGGGGGAGYWFVLRPKAAKPEATAHKTGEGGEGAKAAEGADSGDSAEHGILSLEAFIANLADPEGDRYVKCTMRLEMDKREIAERIKSDDLAITKIRDRVLTLLTSKTFTQIASAQGKDELRSEIQSNLSPLLLGGRVTGVYFTEFIVQ